MTALLTISGIIAALILFRWARLLAMVCLICTAAYFCHGFEVWKAANAQGAPMVQRQVGSYAQVMPDYACRGVEAGAMKLRPNDTHSLFDCAAEIARYTETSYSVRINACNAMFWSMWMAEHAAR